METSERWWEGISETIQLRGTLEQVFEQLWQAVQEESAGHHAGDTNTSEVMPTDNQPSSSRTIA